MVAITPADALVEYTQTHTLDEGTKVEFVRAANMLASMAANRHANQAQPRDFSINIQEASKALLKAATDAAEAVLRYETKASELYAAQSKLNLTRAKLHTALTMLKGCANRAMETQTAKYAEEQLARLAEEERTDR